MGAIVGLRDKSWKDNSWIGLNPIDPTILDKNGRYTLNKGVQYTIKAQNAKITFMGTINSLETSKNSHAWKRVSLDTSKLFYTTDDYIRSTGVDGVINLQVVTPITDNTK